MTSRELHDYRYRRLELADLVRSALYLARSRADGRTEEQARALLARLAEDRLRLAVAGQFSRGKTTLMNAMLGGEFLPTGALPMTSVVTTVTYGSTARASVRRRDATLPIDVPVGQLADYVARSGTHRSVLQVLSAAVELPSELLRQGLSFVDTPGIGSEDATSTAMTRHFLPQADAAIFVTGFDSPLSTVELEFLTELRERVGRLFIVINKRDLAAADQIADVEAYVSAQLAARGLADQPVHSVSALQALRARLSGDADQLTASGLAGLEAELLTFLTKEKSELLLSRSAGRADQLVAALQRDLQLGVLGTSPEVAEAISQQADADVTRLRSELAAVIVDLGDTVSQSLTPFVESHSTNWTTELRRQLAGTVQELTTARAGGPTGEKESGASTDGIEDRLRRATEPIYHAWWDRHVAEAREALTSAGAESIGQLLNVSQSVELIMLRAADLSTDDRERSMTWSAGDVPSFSIAAAPWTTPVRLRWRARRRGPSPDDLRAAVDTALQQATAAAAAALCERLEAAIRRWVEHFADVTDHDVHRATDRMMHQLTSAPSEADSAALTDLRTGLLHFRQGLSRPAGGTNNADSTPDVRDAQVHWPHHDGDRPTAASTCAICTRLQRTLTQELSHEQFRLATMQRAQLEHAELGGFCRLHTWEYAAIGSPVGISSGYARLIASLAAALSAAAGDDAADEADLQDADAVTRRLADVVERHLQRTDSCRICRELDRVEREQAAHWARTPSSNDPAQPTSDQTPVLCLRHLAIVLAAGPTVDRARELTNTMAARLRRASDDMRSFALVREAIRRDLVTSEEGAAYEDALRLVAGLPALARPWTHTDQ